MANTILKVDSLSKKYRNGRGAFDISFELEQGDTFGLLGANGAGKTTVMKMITGLCGMTSGTVEVFGHNILENRARALYKVGAIIESPSFYPYLSARKNLELTLSYYPEIWSKQEHIDRVLTQVGLLDYGKEKTSKYSLGMKQRLGLAMCMVGEPELMILDEPSNGLDIEGRVDIRNIILELSKTRRSTFLISSHLSEEIEKICSKVGIMKEGRLCRIESMKNILSEYPDLETYYLEIIKDTREAV